MTTSEDGKPAEGRRYGGNGRPEGPILVAVDFSADSKEAVLWASRQAELVGLPLVILHVIHDPASSPGFYRRLRPDWLRPMADVAEEMMEEFFKTLQTEHTDLESLKKAETKLVTGLPAGRIVEFAEQVGAALVVIGSQGRTGFQHILLGSVAERVAQLAPMPVVVVKRR